MIMVLLQKTIRGTVKCCGITWPCLPIFATLTTGHVQVFPPHHTDNQHTTWAYPAENKG